MIDLKPACHQMLQLLGGSTSEQLTNPTPCTEYTVGDLIAHVDQVSQIFTALARRDVETPAGPNEARLASDWQRSVPEHVLTLGEAWDEPGAWLGSTNMTGPDFSNELWGKIALTELVVHGWDLGRATGQSFELPAHTQRACLDHVAEFVPNAPIPGLWGPPVDAPAGATLIDQIVSITGRTP